MKLELGDTLVAPGHLSPEGLLPRFDRAVAQLPFTVKNWWTPLEAEVAEAPPADGKRRRKRPAEPNYKKLVDEHKRFGYGIPPRSFGDYAFVQHVLATLKEDGRAALVMPHDVLFRDGDEGRIRNALLFGAHGQSGDRIEAVIGLPPALFYGSGMPTCVVVLNKNKPAPLRNKVILIDASRPSRADARRTRCGPRMWSTFSAPTARRWRMSGRSRIICGWWACARSNRGIAAISICSVISRRTKPPRWWMPRRWPPS